MNRDRLKSWFQASRPAFFVATFIPLGIGWIIAGQQGAWHPGLFLVILLASLMVHMATNLANDYFDHLQGVDAGASIGGSRVLQEGKITLGQLKVALIVLYGASSVMGLWLMAHLSLWAISPLVVIALFSSIFYVAPPIRYGYHGLGEFFVGINMGPVMVVGTYWVIAGRPAWRPLWVSVPVGLMVAAILYYQNLPDMKTDAATGKRTLAVRLGKIGAYRGLVTLWTAIYASILALVGAGLISPLALGCLATVPIFTRLLRLIKETTDWVQLDRYGKLIRMLYFFNGLGILLALVI
jgi:1,4-dihydroxy-2-naphthoate octaprenyltransferase